MTMKPFYAKSVTCRRCSFTVRAFCREARDQPPQRRSKVLICQPDANFNSCCFSFSFFSAVAPFTDSDLSGFAPPSRTQVRRYRTTQITWKCFFCFVCHCVCVSTPRLDRRYMFLTQWIKSTYFTWERIRWRLLRSSKKPNKIWVDLGGILSDLFLNANFCGSSPRPQTDRQTQTLVFTSHARVLRSTRAWDVNCSHLLF